MWNPPRASTCSATFPSGSMNCEVGGEEERRLGIQCRTEESLSQSLPPRDRDALERARLDRAVDEEGGHAEVDEIGGSEQLDGLEDPGGAEQDRRQPERDSG